jgi:phosphoglycolate phosphatase-like HAD superfamily hydrolase
MSRFEITPTKSLLVGIDSDGCAFDTMELKHKECFIPNTINYYELQGVSKYARQAAEFVNLYSKSRGINRFPALIETLEWLQKRPEVAARKKQIDIPESLRHWIATEKVLSNDSLEKKVAETGDPHLKQALAWSKAVNADVKRIVRGVPPFPFCRESLERLSTLADLVVVSATPNEALVAEWNEHGLAGLVTAICGQDLGSKKETLSNATKYGPGRSLMIGDAPGDYSAAMANRCWFFPINPGREEASWERFHNEGIEKFLSGNFTEAYQKELLDEFDRCLPEQPTW